MSAICKNYKITVFDTKTLSSFICYYGLFFFKKYSFPVTYSGYEYMMNETKTLEQRLKAHPKLRDQLLAMLDLADGQIEKADDGKPKGLKTKGVKNQRGQTRLKIKIQVFF